MENEYKLGDKVMFNLEVCTYIGEFMDGAYLINWYSKGHTWRCNDTEARAKKVWYIFSWDKYYYTYRRYPERKKNVGFTLKPLDTEMDGTYDFVRSIIEGWTLHYITPLVCNPKRC